jgi:cytidine deaminase
MLALAGSAGLNAHVDPQISGGRLDPAQVNALMSAQNLSREQLMMKLLPLAKSHAHPPLSSYFVGAVALGSSGSLYLGQNIEIPGNMLGLAVHAEQSAIANAYMAQETGINAIAVTAAPCGHCRQFLSEVSLQMSILMPNLPPISLSELLPRAFGPKDLGLDQGAFPVRRTNLSFASHQQDPLVQAAWDAACQSYSPYTKSPSGVALSTSTGRTFPGSYIENAAFNPSLPPLETALAGYFAAGPAAGDIQRCVLVERQNGGISHLVTTKCVLAALAPAATLNHQLAV